ncbi:chemotaxis protein CheB [Aquabacterium sp.]|uniref:chemotaxis protein CheB n=1 Tax=Aquabacterium sp. TaxID=1872578 RepID=UPI00248803DD|nr:chemotaxis protein CheB [Aquabacterium sp.]MDI1261311.1 chemotaxis protein CheB [Aquabacterium sp.]
MSPHTSTSFDPESQAIQAVVIGASAGGVDALMKVLVGLPASFSLPIMVVLHLPEDKPSRLPEILAYRLQLRVCEAMDKQPIEPGTVYVAPTGYHLSVEADLSLSLSGEAPVNYSRPSIDVLMNSAADAYGVGLVGILLTGANHDGAQGMARIKARGGWTVVQNPEQAQSNTMPLAAIRMRAPDLILSLGDIHALLLKLGREKS